jgi:osmotically-inducible protein OsmY
MDGAVWMMDIATQDVENRAKAALASSPIYILRELRVEKLDDCLLLSGRVDSFYHKQLAQEVVRTVAGGMKVINDVDVD